jgi:hypothetical protein
VDLLWSRTPQEEYLEAAVKEVGRTSCIGLGIHLGM